MVVTPTGQQIKVLIVISEDDGLLHSNVAKQMEVENFTKGL